MNCEVTEIIQNNKIRTYYQPIVSLKDGGIIGYEALSRGPEDTPCFNPEYMFEKARECGKLWELEMICRSSAIANYNIHDSSKLLFINIDTDVLKDSNFIQGMTMELLNKFNINPLNVVLEITEKTSIDDYSSFKKALDYYKNQGYKIAIDDVGTGFSGLTTIANVRPHYIKLDKSLVIDINRDNFKKAMVKSFIEFARNTNIKVIAEGIEEKSVLNTLIELGIDLGQGFFLQRPFPEFFELPIDIKNSITKRNTYIEESRFIPCSAIHVGTIARHDSPVFLTTTCSDVEKIFKQNPKITGIPIVNHDLTIAGLIMNTNFFSRVGTQYGWSLYMKRPIQLLMDNCPLIVDYNTPLDKVSSIVISREEYQLYDYILVKKEGVYYGVVPVIALLEKSMEVELGIAKYSNPLTGLPGNVIIEETILKYINSNMDFSLLYFDINNFKPYNDVYGFENGDKILSFTANVIKKNLTTSGQYFLGHIGGDDFIAILDNTSAIDVCRDIAADFDNGISEFYTSEDRHRGFIEAADRNGFRTKFSIMSISIAVVNKTACSSINITSISEIASEVKHVCKELSAKSGKSSYISRFA